MTGCFSIDVLANLFPAHTIVIQTVYPDMTRIISIPIAVVGCTSRYCFAIARGRNRFTKRVVKPFPYDVLADLLPCAGAKIDTAVKG